MYCSGFNNETVSAPTSSIDVLPTLLNLFGIEYDSRALCGKDAFAQGERIVFFSDGSFKTDLYRYDANSKNSTNIDPEYMTKIKRQISNTVKYSIDSRKNNYFAYIK